MYVCMHVCMLYVCMYVAAALVSLVGLELCGPYHTLSGKLDGVTWRQCALHCRYFYDPPEMVTVLRSTSRDSQFHLGYFRCEELYAFVSEDAVFPHTQYLSVI